MSMKVVIMAGGKGTRISSVASDIPKPMIKIDGTPVLEREIQCLKEQGFENLIITVSHLGHIIMNYFGDRFEKCIELYNLENQLLRQIGIETECQYRLDRQFFIYIKMCIKQLKIIKNKIGVRLFLTIID